MSTYLFDESSVSSTMSSMKSDIEVYRESVTELKKNNNYYRIFRCVGG